MNVLIDPELLAGYTAARTYSDTEILALRSSLEQLTVFSIKYNARVVSTRSLWSLFQERYVGAVFRALGDPAIRTPLQLLRDRVRIVVPDPTRSVLAWGFEQMLGGAAGGQDWAGGFAAIAAELHAADEAVVLFTRHKEGRNVRTLASGASKLVEKTRWRLHIGAPGLSGILAVPCVASVRNVDVPWTARFDDELPDTAPASGCSFVPPSNWHRRYVDTFRVHQSKYAWNDVDGNGWSDPNTPGRAYHWDVFFRAASASPLGISPANIVRWGAPRSEGIPGDVHHIPRAKRSRVV